MSLVTWIMFVAGICLGFIIAGFFVMKHLDSQLDFLMKMDEFCKDYARLCDLQYDKMSSHVENKFESIKNIVNRLCDITSDSIENNVEFTNNISKLLIKHNDLVSGVVNSFYSRMEDISDTNDERWNLIHDYIVNENIEKVITNTITDIFSKEDKSNEQEMGTTDGTPESGDAGNKETEQAEVFSGETYGELVQPELEENRDGSASETPEGV